MLQQHKVLTSSFLYKLVWHLLVLKKKAYRSIPAQGSLFLHTKYMASSSCQSQLRAKQQPRFLWSSLNKLDLQLKRVLDFHAWHWEFCQTSFDCQCTDGNFLLKLQMCMYQINFRQIVNTMIIMTFAGTLTVKLTLPFLFPNQCFPFFLTSSIRSYVLCSSPFISPSLAMTLIYFPNFLNYSKICNSHLKIWSSEFQIKNFVNQALSWSKK